MFMKKLLLILGTFFTVLIIFAGVTFLTSAIPAHSQREDTKSINGKLTSLSTCCPGGDIIFNLENDNNKTYYINRGVQSGLVVKELENELKGKEVTLLYHKGGWNVMNFKKSLKHVCEVRMGNKVLYSELTN